MPLCGFTELMLSSLQRFNDELVSYGLEHRSQVNKESVDQALRREISDMSRLMLEIDRIDDSAKRMLTEGMVRYALGFYLLVRKTGVEQSEVLNKNIIEYFRFMDEIFYKELEGDPDDMRQLVGILNKKKLVDNDDTGVEQATSISAANL